MRKWLIPVFVLGCVLGCGTPGGGSGGGAAAAQLEALGGMLTLNASGNVVEADFSGRPLGDPDLAVIAQHGSLQKLWLTNTGITDNGLVQLQSMPNLRVLGLARTTVSDAGLGHLAGIRTLREVYLYPNKVTDGAVETLKTRLPGIKVVY